MLHGKVSTREYLQEYRRDVAIYRWTGRCPDGRITLHRWAQLNGKLWSEAVALADAGQLLGYISEGRWIALDLDIEPIELRLRLSGYHMPKRLAPDLVLTPQGKIRIRPKVGD